MVSVKPLGEAQSNFKQGASLAPARYAAGVQRTNNWQASAIAGQGLYEEKMRDAEVLSRRHKKLQGVSDAEWKSRALSEGAKSIGVKMAAADSKWAKGWEPHRLVIESVQLPARTADAATNVTNRVVPLAVALQNKKKSG